MGSIVRALLLVVLVLVVVPAVVIAGEVLAVPAVALMLLAVIAVAIVGLVYWLATVGAPAGWLARRLRLTPDRFLIVAAATAGAAAAIALVWLRVELGRRHSPLGQFDLRAASTAVRLANERGLMQALNRAGIRSMVVLSVMLVVAALVARAFRSAALLAATVALGGALVEVLKTQPASPLPPLGGVALGPPTSWPSGHAALQCSVAFGIVLWWWGAGLPRPSFVAAVVLPLAAAVGYSRAYLGFHWLSEIFAGWCVAVVAGAVVLVVDRLLAGRFAIPPPPKRWLVVAAGVAALVVTAIAIQAVQRDRGGRPREAGGFGSPNFRLAGSAQTFTPTQLTSADPAALIDPLPRFSQTLLGRRSLPVGLVVAATSDQLQAAFEQSGWTEVAAFSPRDLAPDFWAGLRGEVVRPAPVVPTFFDTRAADAVLERPAPGPGAATQEASIWQVPLVTPGGCPVWVVTTALVPRDDRTWRTVFPTLRFAPSIDGERDALAQALAGTGRVDDLGRFGNGESMRGTTPSGAYVTDGKVAVIRQPGC